MNEAIIYFMILSAVINAFLFMQVARLNGIIDFHRKKILQFDLYLHLMAYATKPPAGEGA